MDTMSQYRFTGPTDQHYWIIPAGNAMTYNHSTKENCMTYHEQENRLLVFKAIKDIKKDEEVLWNYGPNYKYNRINKKNQHLGYITDLPGRFRLESKVIINGTLVSDYEVESEKYTKGIFDENGFYIKEQNQKLLYDRLCKDLFLTEEEFNYDDIESSMYE